MAKARRSQASGKGCRGGGHLRRWRSSLALLDRVMPGGGNEMEVDTLAGSCSHFWPNHNFGDSCSRVVDGTTAIPDKLAHYCRRNAMGAHVLLYYADWCHYE